MKYLPTVGQYYELNYFTTIKNITTTINTPGIKFMLININPAVPSEVLEYIDKLIYENKLAELPTISGYKFVRIL